MEIHCVWLQVSEVSLPEDLLKLVGGSDSRVEKMPESWRPRMEVDADGGFVVSTPRPAGGDADGILEEFELNPAEWQVVAVRRSKWQRWDGEWLESFRLSLKPAGHRLADGDIDEFVAGVAKWRPSKASRKATGPLTAVFAIGDTQYGKDAGDGTLGSIERVMRGLDASLVRHREWLKAGRELGTVCLPQLGDCVEGTVSQNGKVLGRSDLGPAGQVRVGRRVLMQWVKAFAPLCERLIVPAINGNHDEPARYVISDPADGWQTEVVSAVQDACQENPDLAHVEFRFPERDHQTLTVDVGVMLGLAHGHQARDLPKWWAAQSSGRTAIGGADILLTGHYHHYRVQQVGPRLWVQVPAMDGGSPWFRDRHGLESPTGVVALTVGAGWDCRTDLGVVGGEYR